jgi:hypothetical protein
VLGKAGIAGAARKAARRHKWTRIDPKRARPGDIGIATMTFHEKGRTIEMNSMVACFARGWFAGRAAVGFTAMPAKLVRMAWCVVP